MMIIGARRDIDPRNRGLANIASVVAGQRAAKLFEQDVPAQQKVRVPSQISSPVDLALIAQAFQQEFAEAPKPKTITDIASENVVPILGGVAAAGALALVPASRRAISSRLGDPKGAFVATDVSAGTVQARKMLGLNARGIEVLTPDNLNSLPPELVSTLREQVRGQITNAPALEGASLEVLGRRISPNISQGTLSKEFLGVSQDAIGKSNVLYNQVVQSFRDPRVQGVFASRFQAQNIGSAVDKFNESGLVQKVVSPANRVFLNDVKPIISNLKNIKTPEGLLKSIQDLRKIERGLRSSKSEVSSVIADQVNELTADISKELQKSLPNNIGSALLDADNTYSMGKGFEELASTPITPEQLEKGGLLARVKNLIGRGGGDPEKVEDFVRLNTTINIIGSDVAQNDPKKAIRTLSAIQTRDIKKGKASALVDHAIQAYRNVAVTGKPQGTGGSLAGDVGGNILMFQFLNNPTLLSSLLFGVSSAQPSTGFLSQLKNPKTAAMIQMLQSGGSLPPGLF